MRSLILLAAVAIAPSPALAQNWSSTTQYGFGNLQRTIQAGENYAASAQVGNGNTGSISQVGKNNFAGLAQMGSGHTKTIEQVGENTGIGVIQASRSTYNGTFVSVGGNANVSVTVEVTVE